ncbi:MAG: hypothetical protein Q9175_001346 [Cornicularia normoerica]
MSIWKQPHQRLLQCSEPSATGRGLGVINRKYFESATWEPLLGTEMGRGQYSKFVASMIERIRAKESSFDEIRSFVHLVATEHNWNFMEVAMPFLPELKEHPHDTKNFELALLFLLKPKVRRRSIKEVQNAIHTPKTYENGLSKTEAQLLRRNLFGPDRGAVSSSGMNRLFKSTLELAYPQPALDQSMHEAKERGTDIERCCEGLPMRMLIPDVDTRPDKFSSSSHDYASGTPWIWTPSTSAESSRVPSSSAIGGDKPIDSPPRELLTEMAVNGVDPPVPTTPNKTTTSHGELPKLNRIEDIETFIARLAESPNCTQVPCDEPHRVQYGPGEREAFKAYYKKPASVFFLNYFHILERMPDPPTSEAGTKWPDCPNSPSSPGHSHIAAAPKQPDGH